MIALMAAALMMVGEPSSEVFAGRRVGASCLLRGTLHFSLGVPYSGASVTTANGICVPVAAPPAVMQSHKRWEGRQVVVKGPMLERSGEEETVLSTRYKDRWLVIGTCPPGPAVLYATELRRDRSSAFHPSRTLPRSAFGPAARTSSFRPVNTFQYRPVRDF